jgi:hypothetical protein
MTQKPGGKTMLHARQKSILDDLRARIAHLERAQQKWAPVLCLDTRQNKDLEHGARTPDSVLPFGIKEIDSRLPQGGLALGALHEIAGGGLGAVAAAAGEISGLPMTASRRLQLAAEASGVPALIIRRWRTPAAAADFGQPSGNDTLANQRASLLAFAGCGRRPAALARRAHPLPCRRLRGMGIGGLRCQGPSRSTCRFGRPTGCGGSWAPPRLCLKNRSFLRARMAAAALSLRLIPPRWRLVFTPALRSPRHKHLCLIFMSQPPIPRPIQRR